MFTNMTEYWRSGSSQPALRLVRYLLPPLVGDLVQPTSDGCCDYSGLYVIGESREDAQNVSDDLWLG